jgi:hypothetical protein
MLGTEALEGRFEHRQLEAGDGRVVDLRRGAHLRESRAEAGIAHDGLRAARALHFEHGGHVDEHHVERMAAGRAVRRIQRRVRRKQRVHRADADEVRALRGREAQDLLQVGEITDAPVVLRAQRVELHGHAPQPAARGQRGRLVALVRRDDQRTFVAAGEFEVQMQPVIPRRQVRGQRQVAQHVPLALARVGTAFRQIPGTHLAAPFVTALELHAPAQRRVVFDGRGVDAHGAHAVAQHRDLAQQPLRMRGLGFADLRLQHGRIVEPAIHGAQDGGLGGQREMLQLALVRVVRVTDAAGTRQPLDERAQRLEGWRLSGHAAAPAPGAGRPSPARPAGGSPTTPRPDARCRRPRPSRWPA